MQGRAEKWHREKVMYAISEVPFSADMGKFRSTFSASLSQKGRTTT